MPLKLINMQQTCMKTIGTFSSTHPPCDAPPRQAAAPDSDASLVCPHLLPQFGFLHMIQDVDVHLQLDRLDMGMSRAMAMLEALCESEGINSSSSMEAESDMSALPLPDGPPSGDVNSFDT